MSLTQQPPRLLFTNANFPVSCINFPNSNIILTMHFCPRAITYALECRAYSSAVADAGPVSGAGAERVAYFQIKAPDRLSFGRGRGLGETLSAADLLIQPNCAETRRPAALMGEPRRENSPPPETDCPRRVFSTAAN